jgi:hypothetical protein
MHSKEQFSLIHSATIRPEDFLRFVEIEPFPRLWADTKLEDQDLQILQIGIMAGPTDHPVIPGSNGLRKLRFSTPKNNTGKRGAFRVYYSYFEDYGIVLLMAILAKNRQRDLTKADIHALAQVLARAKILLDKGVIR